MLTSNDGSLTNVIFLSLLIILVVVFVVFLVLWVRANSRLKAAQSDMYAKEQTRIGLELAVADQVGRLKLIRELHQVTVVQVGHLVTKADSARVTVQDRDEYAARAFEKIVEQANETRENMRRVLNLVTEGEVLAQPQPRLKSVQDLVHSIREAGLTVDLEETGNSYELKPGAEIAIYRVLQESFNNVLKHGGAGTEVWITMNWTDQGIQLNIDDDGVRNKLRQAKDNGYGLEGAEAAADVTIEKDKDALVQAVNGPGIRQMRQRVELYGGYLNAHEVPGVGFSVQATFPNIRLGGVNLPTRSND